MSNTGCPKCNKKQELTRDQTALCDTHELEYLQWTFETALRDYLNKVSEIVRKGERMMSKENYTMQAICSNCGTTFCVHIKQGCKTSDHYTKCPYCGRSSDYIDGGFYYKKPEGVIF